MTNAFTEKKLKEFDKQFKHSQFVDYAKIKSFLQSAIDETRKGERERIKEKLEALDVEKMLADTPHDVVYEPKYPGELYVVSGNYKKLASQVKNKIRRLI